MAGDAASAFSPNTVYLDSLGKRLSGHPDIFRLITRGLLRYLRGAISSCRISQQETPKASAYLGEKARRAASVCRAAWRVHVKEMRRGLRQGRELLHR